MSILSHCLEVTPRPGYSPPWCTVPVLDKPRVIPRGRGLQCKFLVVHCVFTQWVLPSELLKLGAGQESLIQVQPLFIRPGGCFVVFNLFWVFCLFVFVPFITQIKV